MISCSLLWREKKLHKLHCWWAGEGPPSYAKLIIAHWWNICCIRVTSSWVPGATGENPRRWCGVSDLQKNEARGLTSVYISNHIYKDEKELVGAVVRFWKLLVWWDFFAPCLCWLMFFLLICSLVEIWWANTNPAWWGWCTWEDICLGVVTLSFSWM